jgi:Xaa-Pro aminopeptidase
MMARARANQKTQASKGRASHDPVFPAAFVDFMLAGWKAQDGKLPPPIKGHARHMARRDILSEHFAGEHLIIPTGHEKVRSNDTNYRFRPGTDFYYLTGNHEADCVLVLAPDGASGHKSILFVEPNPGRKDSTFFTDRHKGELWVGARLGVSESQSRYQVDAAQPIDALGAYLKALKSGKSYRVLRGLSGSVDKLLPARKQEDGALASALSEARLYKDSSEIASLERAALMTKKAFEDVIGEMKSAKCERELEGAFCRRARIEGNDCGYNIIVAGGANACILHWSRNNGSLRKQDLVLIDAGVETNELYTADVTRTLPIGGKFSPAQREVYELVMAAQSAALGAVVPENDFLAPHHAAMKVLAAGLVEMGILKGPLEQVMSEKNLFYKRYTLHGVSHMLGIDVHDCASARAETYRNGKLKPGMVLTIEPGLYFQPDDLTVPNKYRGIGVRVEDDVLVTNRGHRVLTDIPRQSDEIERWIQRIWSKKKN